MDNVFNFILEFKDYFIYGFLALVSLFQLLVLLLKKKVIVCTSIQEFILKKLPVLIIKYESSVKGSLCGSVKKKYVFNEIIKLVSEEYNLSSDIVIKNFNKFINYHIEEILCTPQSKGGNFNG